MSVAKVITIIGSSPESFAKAAAAAVEEASKTVRGIHGADVVSMTCKVGERADHGVPRDRQHRLRDRALEVTLSARRRRHMGALFGRRLDRRGRRAQPHPGWGLCP